MLPKSMTLVVFSSLDHVENVIPCIFTLKLLISLMANLSYTVLLRNPSNGCTAEPLDPQFAVTQ